MNAMNALNRYDLYVLEDGEKPVEVIEDTKIPNAATIKVLKQDHTLGNMLRAQLLAMPQILFAGYQVPHPLHPYFLIKIQTDGSITPQALLDEAGKKLIRTLVSLESKFKREFSYKDVEGTVGASVVSGAAMAVVATAATTTTTTTTTTTAATTSHLDVDPYGGATMAASATTAGGAGATGGAWGTGKDYLDL